MPDQNENKALKDRWHLERNLVSNFVMRLDLLLDDDTFDPKVCEEYTKLRDTFITKFNNGEEK